MAMSSFLDPNPQFGRSTLNVVDAAVANEFPGAAQENCNLELTPL